MCGIIALLLADPQALAAPEILEGLSMLQHRGQDAAGIVTCGRKGRLFQVKANGMVRDVFDTPALRSLFGSIGIGHVRYPTAGTSAHSEAQPFYVNSPYGIAFAHNGNLINAPELRAFCDDVAHRHINTDSDSELLLNILANNLQMTGKRRINEEDIFQAIRDLTVQCRGAYACVAMIAGFGIIAFRDPNGIRPMGYGRRRSKHGRQNDVERDVPTAGVSGTVTPLPHGYGSNPQLAYSDTNGYDYQTPSTKDVSKRMELLHLDADGKVGDWDYIFASESVVGDALSFEDWHDVAPGEAIIMTRTSFTRRQVVERATFAPDIFEYVYFARPDSVLDGISVYRSRLNMGDALADEVRRVLGQKARESRPHDNLMLDSGMDIDVVIPVPDTSRVAALETAQKLGIPYREGFIKNRYVGRTFIMPGQSMRRKNVRRKLNAMAMEFSGKNVLIVDDSIVRGTTSKEIVQMARDAGAKKVYFASCAPPIRYSNVYGIDMPSRHELVAHDRSVAEVAEEIGADLVIYQALHDLVRACRRENPTIEAFDCSVFTGVYITGGIDNDYLDRLENLRRDKARRKKETEKGPEPVLTTGDIVKSSPWPASSEEERGRINGTATPQASLSTRKLNGRLAPSPTPSRSSLSANGSPNQRRLSTQEDEDLSASPFMAPSSARQYQTVELEDDETKASAYDAVPTPTPKQAPVRRRRMETEDEDVYGCSGPMNGADDAGSEDATNRYEDLALSNSWHGSQRGAPVP